MVVSYYAYPDQRKNVVTKSDEGLQLKLTTKHVFTKLDTSELQPLSTSPPLSLLTTFIGETFEVLGVNTFFWIIPHVLIGHVGPSCWPLWAQHCTALNFTAVHSTAVHSTALYCIACGFSFFYFSALVVTNKFRGLYLK